MLESHGIEVIPFVTGEAEEILECYVQGKDLKDLPCPDAAMRDVVGGEMDGNLQRNKNEMKFANKKIKEKYQAAQKTLRRSSRK